jgi:hypothetical protein
MRGPRAEEDGARIGVNGQPAVNRQLLPGDVGRPATQQRDQRVEELDRARERSLVALSEEALHHGAVRGPDPERETPVQSLCAVRA